MSDEGGVTGHHFHHFQRSRDCDDVHSSNNAVIGLPYPLRPGSGSGIRSKLKFSPPKIPLKVVQPNNTNKIPIFKILDIRGRDGDRNISETGTGPRIGIGARIETGTSTGAGAGTGAEARSGAGTGTGVETGTGTGTGVETRTETGAGAGTGTRTETDISYADQTDRLRNADLIAENNRDCANLDGLQIDMPLLSASQNLKEKFQNNLRADEENEKKGGEIGELEKGRRLEEGGVSGEIGDDSNNQKASYDKISIVPNILRSFPSPPQSSSFSPSKSSSRLSLMLSLVHPPPNATTTTSTITSSVPLPVPSSSPVSPPALPPVSLLFPSSSPASPPVHLSPLIPAKILEVKIEQKQIPSGNQNSSRRSVPPQAIVSSE